MGHGVLSDATTTAGTMTLPDVWNRHYNLGNTGTRMPSRRQQTHELAPDNVWEAVARPDFVVLSPPRPIIAIFVRIKLFISAHLRPQPRQAGKIDVSSTLSKCDCMPYTNQTMILTPIYIVLSAYQHSYY